MEKKTIVKGNLETRNFTFECYGKTEVETKKIMKKTLTKHFSGDIKMVREFLNDVQYSEIEIGGGYVDHYKII